jgi:hypothetical protein
VAVAAQHDLSEVTSSSSNDGLPLPSDLPLVGRYQTRFNELFANRPAPAAIGRINATLPLYLDLINARADSVDAGQHALNTAVDAYQSGQVRIERVLQQYVQLRDQRIAFLAVIRDYNNAIADYALRVARPGLSVQEVVSMLVVTSSNSPVARQARLDSRPRVKPSVGIVPVKPAPTSVPTIPQSDFPVDLSPESINPTSPVPITLDPR